MGMRKDRKKEQTKNRVRMALLVILLMAVVSLILILVSNPVKLYSDSVTAEYKEPFYPAKQIKSVRGGERKDVKIEGKVDTGKIGDYTLTYSFKKHEKKLKVTVKDTKPPKLTVKQVKTDTKGDIDASEFVKKASDKDKVKIKYGKRKGNKKEGNHKVDIIAEDPSGNSTTKEATLVRVKDVTAPEITGLLPITTVLNSEIDLKQSVVVNDDLDPEPKVEIIKGIFNTDQPGTYNVKYVAKDRSGNLREYTRTITVIDNRSKGNLLAGKNVYLTFDDGPSQNTAKILDILKKEGVKATFFVTGNGQNYNYLITRAAKEGHTVALHTYTHQYSIYRSKETYFADLQKISNMVESLTGKKSMFIRFPGGSSNTVSRQYCSGIMTDLVAEITRRGYTYYDWNCSSGDAEGNTMPKDYIIRNACSGKGDNINILFHDSAVKTTTVQALPAVIEYYKKLGYSFQKVQNGCFAPHHGINN